MSQDNLCVGAHAEQGEHTCMLLLRPTIGIPKGLWSWLVYVDGYIHARGPGSKRKDSEHWYAPLLSGEHRLVIRDSKTTNPNRKESNTLYFIIGSESEVLIDVSYVDDEMHLEIL